MSTALLFALSVLSQLPEDGWVENAHPCADSSTWNGGEWGDIDWHPRDFGGTLDVEDCDPEVAGLFSAERASEQRGETRRDTAPVPRRRDSQRASLSVSGGREGSMESILRHSAARDGWDHRAEMRDDAPGRWRLGYSGDGWRIVAGEMTDTALPAWPRALPRRSLPVGWRAARGTETDPLPLSAPVPQGIALGTLRAGWKAYALRAWNPVETGREPPWNEPWDLRHAAAGTAFDVGDGGGAPPWTASLHLSETRIGRNGRDTLSERLLAAGLSSRAQGVDLAAALSESDAAGSGGWFAAAHLRHRFDIGAEASLLVRQRGAGWVSAWDPAIAKDAAHGLASDSDEAGEDGEAGAGEARVSGRLPFRENGSRREAAFVRGEAWRAWNPPAGTWRQGARATLGRRLDDARLELSATHRASRAASGSVSLYRFVRAEAELESFPRPRAEAWRAWNGDGILRTGLLLGMEPRGRAWRVSPALRLESDAAGDIEGLALLETRLRLAPGWNLEASGALPCLPLDAGAARWRLSVTGGR